jgi:cytoplasmic iron level regulating protein YaaA (DUF328/UPF0246 family)
MILLLSPAKSIDSSTRERNLQMTQPPFLEDSAVLASVMKKYSPGKLSKLMKINAHLAQLNAQRYQEWSTPFTESNAKATLFSFRGDVFLGLDAVSLDDEAVQFAQDHLRILSGLYGILRPLDLMQPYRLEMGLPLKFRRYKNLYHFWSDKLAKFVEEEAEEQEGKPVIVNLASEEYFSAVGPHLKKSTVIKPVFKENKNGEYRFIHVFGKKARGLMTRFILENKITDPEQMKLFDSEGYFYNDRLTKGNEWVFTRG